MDTDIPDGYAAIPLGNGRVSASFQLAGNRLALIRAAFSLAEAATLVFTKPIVAIEATQLAPDMRQCAAAAEALHPGIVARRDDWPADSKVAKHYQRLLDDTARIIAESLGRTG